MNTFVTDLNADLGESPERLANGSEAELMQYITSANIACGGHAGDAPTMEQTLELARANGVAAGAHPSYPDRAGFGRAELSMALHELQDSIADQINQLLTIATRLKVPVVHVKPHGALYHTCNHNQGVARALCRAVAAVDSRMVIIGQAGSPCLDVYREMGFSVAAEAFVDRAYEPDGSLRNRRLSGALLDSTDSTVAQALQIVLHGRVTTIAGSELSIIADTLCVHSDTPGSAVIARAVRERLSANGVVIRALSAGRF